MYPKWTLNFIRCYKRYFRIENEREMVLNSENINVCLQDWNQRPQHPRNTEIGRTTLQTVFSGWCFIARALFLSFWHFRVGILSSECRRRSILSVAVAKPTPDSIFKPKTLKFPRKKIETSVCGPAVAISLRWSWTLSGPGVSCYAEFG